MERFSFGILSFGSQKALDATIERSKKWGGEYIIISLDMKEGPKGDLVLPWDFLLTDGYADVWNRIHIIAETEFVYILGMGKEILQFDPNWDFDIMPCTRPKEGRWYKLGRREVIWKGRVHEEMHYNGWSIDKENRIVWDYFEVDFTTWARVYRWFSRVKWLRKIQLFGREREGINKGWWTNPTLKLNDKTLHIWDKWNWILKDHDTFMDNAHKVWGDLTT